MCPPRRPRILSRAVPAPAGRRHSAPFGGSQQNPTQRVQLSGRHAPVIVGDQLDPVAPAARARPPAHHRADLRVRVSDDSAAADRASAHRAHVRAHLPLVFAANTVCATAGAGPPCQRACARERQQYHDHRVARQAVRGIAAAPNGPERGRRKRGRRRRRLISRKAWYVQPARVFGEGRRHGRRCSRPRLRRSRNDLF